MGQVALSGIVRRTRKTNREHGFTLVEALISSVVLVLAVTVMAELYYTGMQVMEAQAERALLDGSLRSRMELLISQRFNQVTSGADTVTVNGVDYPITWTVANVDLDGDMAPEAGAKEIRVTLDGRTLTTIVADHSGRVGKM